MKFRKIEKTQLPDQVKSESVNKLILEQEAKSRVNHSWD